VCIDSTRQCVQCTEDSHCSQNPNIDRYKKVCDTSNNVCVACTSNTHCRSDSNCNAYCSANTCHDDPVNVTDCTTDPVYSHCAVSEAKCVKCAHDSHCSMPNPYCTSTYECHQCAAHAHCRSSSHCDSFCNTTYSCHYGSLTCESPLFCDINNGACARPSTAFVTKPYSYLVFIGIILTSTIIHL
jgi:hypothetical protein